MFSVVIPAHNEAQVIGRCLSSLTQTPYIQQMQIIVVCNGCTDNTAQLAREYAHVLVLDIAQASKIAALNAGDEAAEHYPVVFLDADVQLSAQDLCGTVEAFRGNTVAKVAAPRLRVDTTNSSFMVKAFYSIWTRLPYFAAGQMVGSGVFMLSQHGRESFEKFPDIISDDGYVRSLFQENERYMVKDYSFTIFAPKNLANLIKIKTRARFGNLELTAKYPSLNVGKDNRLGDIVKLVVKNPWLALSGLIYIYIQLQTKRLSRARFKAQDFTTWERDESSRSL